MDPQFCLIHDSVADRFYFFIIIFKYTVVLKKWIFNIIYKIMATEKFMYFCSEKFMHFFAPKKNLCTFWAKAIFHASGQSVIMILIGAESRLELKISPCVDLWRKNSVLVLVYKKVRNGRPSYKKNVWFGYSPAPEYGHFFNALTETI